MYQAHGRYAQAGSHYQQLDISSRIEGASPHQLVSVMFDELRRALAMMRAGIRARDFTRRGEAQRRALAILSALDGSLNHQAGGEVAVTLARVYREARRLVLKAGAEGSEVPVETASSVIGEVAAAWDAIG